MDYFIADNGQQRGPFSPEQLRAQGLRGDMLVWADGMGQWERADRVPALQAVLAPAAAAPQSGPEPYAAPAYAPPGPMPGGPPGGYYAPPTAPGPMGYAPPAGYGYPPGGYVTPYNQSDVSSKKVTAGLCGILLGGFGIHKFILGYTSAGVTYLLISIVGGALTCGAATGVMGIIGLIEGIIYLTKSDQDFYNQYIVQQKQWF